MAPVREVRRTDTLHSSSVNSPVHAKVDQIVRGYSSAGDRKNSPLLPHGRIELYWAVQMRTIQYSNSVAPRLRSIIAEDSWRAVAIEHSPL